MRKLSLDEDGIVLVLNTPPSPILTAFTNRTMFTTDQVAMQPSLYLAPRHGGSMNFTVRQQMATVDKHCPGHFCIYVHFLQNIKKETCFGLVTYNFIYLRNHLIHIQN
jgi:hypothetical protein